MFIAPKRMTRKRLAPCLIAAASLSLARPSHADLPDDRDHALPCRPTIACTADLVPPGTFEVEGGGLYRRLQEGREHQWSSPLLLKQTFTEALQIQVGTNGYTSEGGAVSTHYLDDVTVGPKLHILDQSGVRPSVSLSAVASIPTFHREGYLRTYDALFTGYVTKDFGPIHADLNAGVNAWRLGSQPLPQAFTALALSRNFTAKLAGMVETYVFSNAAPVASRDGGLLFAVSETARSWLVFDQGADIGFFPSTRSFSVFIGVTMIPAVLWHPRRGEGASAPAL